MRFRLWSALKGKIKKDRTLLLIGCDIKQLQSHLESKFVGGMHWGNYGRGGWSVDHVRPLSSFNLRDKEQVKIACHYTNLQPLWELDNIKKGNKIL